MLGGNLRSIVRNVQLSNASSCSLRPTFPRPNGSASPSLQIRTYMRGLQNSPSRKAQLLQEKVSVSGASHLCKYDALLAQTINLIMRHGEKAKATTLFNSSLDHVKKMSEQPDSSLPQEVAPIALFHQAIEKLAPIVETKGFKRGQKAIQIPRALNQRQQYRKAITFILEAAKKRSDKEFGKRLGNEIIAVLNGNSQAIKRKEEIYKVALANRANVNVKMNI